MLESSCTICGTPIYALPDSPDACCVSCEDLNLAGDPLRQGRSGMRERHPQRWWRRQRPALPPVPDGLRALTLVHGPWVWSPDDEGSEERGDA